MARRGFHDNIRRKARRHRASKLIPTITRDNKQETKTHNPTGAKNGKVLVRKVGRRGAQIKTITHI